MIVLELAGVEFRRQSVTSRKYIVNHRKVVGVVWFGAVTFSLPFRNLSRCIPCPLSARCDGVVVDFDTSYMDENFRIQHGVFPGNVCDSSWLRICTKERSL